MKDTIEIKHMLHVVNSPNISYLEINNIFVGTYVFFCVLHQTEYDLIHVCVLRQFDFQFFLKIQKYANILDFLIHFYY